MIRQIVRDNYGNLPPGTRISVVRTPTGSIIMGTTTVANLNRQIDEDRARLVSTGRSLGEWNAYNRCVETTQSFVLAGLLFAISGSAITLIGVGVAGFFPPAEAALPFIEAGVLIGSIAFVLCGAIYYGVNCHPPQ
jgi:hypothetical protein